MIWFSLALGVVVVGGGREFMFLFSYVSISFKAFSTQ